jgi:hypothetical protein
LAALWGGLFFELQLISFAVGVGFAETSMASFTARLAISSNEAMEPEPVLKVSPSKSDHTTTNKVFGLTIGNFALDN